METLPKILVTVLHQGWIRPELSSLMAQIASDARVKANIVLSNVRPSENNRNGAAQMAIEGGYDFLLTIDHDTVCIKNPIDFSLLGLDIVGAAYPQWNMTDPKWPLYFLGMKRVEGGYQEYKERHGLQEVDAVGSGCLMVSRRVLEVVTEPFMRKWENGIAVTGLDFFFCEKAKEKGFKVYCHYDYPCSHFKEVDLMDVYRFKVN